MAAVNDILFGYKGRVSIGEIELDASISEVHTLEADVTEHSVEEGSDIVDHYRPKPRPLQIEGVVSDSPIQTGYPGQTLVNSAQSVRAGSKPSKDAWELAKSYFSSGTLVPMVTSLDTYENMALTSFSVTRDSATGLCLKFSCTAKQLRITRTETIAAIRVPKTTTAAKEKPKGKKPTKPATPEQRKSMFIKGWEALT